jgi:glutathione S-transferase
MRTNRIHPAQALYAHDRLARASGRRLRPRLPEPLIGALHAAQRGRGPSFRRAARLVAELLRARPFAVANAPTALLLALLLLRMDGWDVRVTPRDAEAALLRWNARRPDPRALEAWFRRRCGPRINARA